VIQVAPAAARRRNHARRCAPRVPHGLHRRCRNRNHRS